MPDKRLFHYTVGVRFQSILEDRIIKPADALVDTGRERPVVWCSHSPEWEPTCNKMWWDKETDSVYHLSKEETETAGEGLVRIEVRPEDAPHDWEDFCRLSGCQGETGKWLYAAAVKLGSDPRLWRVSFNPIPLDRWLDIEGFRDEQWLSIFPAEVKPN